MKGAKIIGCSSPLVSSSSISLLVSGIVPSIAAQLQQRRHGLERLSICNGHCDADTMFTLLTWCHSSLRHLSLCTSDLSIILVADIHSLGMPALESFEWCGQVLDHSSLGVVCRFARSLPNLKSLSLPGSLTDAARVWARAHTKGGKKKGQPELNIRFITHEHQ